MKLSFRQFDLDTTSFELRRAGQRVHLERRPMEALIYLISRRGELVTREELIARLWGEGVVIEFDTAVHTLIRKIRQVLQDSVDQPVFIETVARKGYRFIAPVEEHASVPAPDTTALTSTPLANNLRWWALMAVALLAVVIWVSYERVPTKPQRIAVLAFTTLGPASDLEYLGYGLAEDTSASLAQMDPARLEVVGPMSTLAAGNAQKDLATLSRELNLAYAVQGTLRVEGTHVRVTANLLRQDSATPIWTASFDRELTSVLGLQRELSAAIARQVQIHVSPEREAMIARRQTDNPQAYDRYLRGRHAWRQLNPLGNRDAVRYFQEALDMDPNYALAWAGLAITFSTAPVNGDADPALLRERAHAATERALRYGAGLAESQLAAGYNEFWLGGSWANALAQLRKAIELDPSNALAHMMAGHVLSQMGEQLEAQAMLQRARELDPLFPMTYALSSQIAFQAREFDKSLEFARQTMAGDPEFWIGYMQLGQVLEQTGDRDAAIAVLEKSIRLSGGNSKAVALRGYTLGRMGRVDEARAELARLTAKAQQAYVPSYAFALLHAGLGEEEAAREWLEKAVASRDPHLAFLTMDPKWDAWRNRAWFEAIIEVLRAAGRAP